MFKAIRSTMREAAVLVSISIIILIFKPEFSHGHAKWQGDAVFFNLECRLLETIQSHVIKVEEIIESTNDMRFMYEESPHYEMGYVIGEIIERYRKTVEFAKLYTRVNHTDPLLTVSLRLELVQKLYLETYHLVQMFNEIPRKYAGMTEFKDIFITVDQDVILRQQRKEQQQRKRREKASKKMAKMYKKLSEAYSKSKKGAYDERKSPENKMWPIDYGWEIDPKWLIN